MFKKLLVVGLATLLSCGVAFADPGNGNHFGTDWNPGNHYGWGDNGNGNGNGGCGGPDCVGTGDFGAFAAAGSLDFDMDGKRIPNGKAFGMSGYVGGAFAAGAGEIENGEGHVYADATGGGFTITESERYTPLDVNDNPLGDKRIGVRSQSYSQAIASAALDIAVDPDGFGKWKGWRRPYFKVYDPASGHAVGMIGGFAAQGTLNFSKVTESPRYFDSTGKSFGVAGQGSVGAFIGGVYVVSGPDTQFICWPINSYASANIAASIFMEGASLSQSFRWVETNDGFKTEGMGTQVNAWTNVETSYTNENSNFLGFLPQGTGIAGSFVEGGFIAVGGAKTMTVQNAPGMGGAIAGAQGTYFGAGELGCNYEGSATGYSVTTVTTHESMKGSVNSAHAGMHVVSRVNTNQ